MMRSEVPAALDVERPKAPPYSFKGQPCNLNQLRILLADAADFGLMPRILMDDRGIYLQVQHRRVMFTRSIDPITGVSVVGPDYTEGAPDATA